MKELGLFEVPAHAITLWWLGQAGFVAKSPGGKLVVLDPYLSNSCQAVAAQSGFDMARQVPPPMTPQDLAGVDLYLITHSHQDHLDPETILPYRAAGGAGPFVAPPQSVDKLRSLGVPEEQTIVVWPSKQVLLGDLTVIVTFAIPFGADDVTHVGYLLSVESGPSVYFTGDTAYHDILALGLGERKPDVLVTVINGAFRNLGPAEAAHLAKLLDVRCVIPCHHDLFPDNSLPARLLRTNLCLEGLGDRFQPLEHGVPFTFGCRSEALSAENNSNFD
jgi:L-ascorbate 6-phosphate lactonase